MRLQARVCKVLDFHGQARAFFSKVACLALKLQEKFKPEGSWDDNAGVLPHFRLEGSWAPIPHLLVQSHSFRAWPAAKLNIMLRSSESYWGQVEVTTRMEWPRDRAEQEALLCDIRSREWSLLTEGETKVLVEENYQAIACLDMETRHGLRKFMVWRPPPSAPLWVPGSVLIARQRMVQGQLVVTSVLEVLGAAITASFYMLSGKSFGSCSFEITMTEQELYMSNLKEAAAELALDQDILESEQQSLQLFLQGFSQALPDEFLVWEGVDITQEALERRLCYLLRGVAAQ